MIDAATLRELHSIATAALEAAAREDTVEAEYERLRARAWELNRRYDWASQEEFAGLLPTRAALAEIDSLLAALGPVFNDPPSYHPAAAPDTSRALLEAVGGWATGILAAHRTLNP